MDTKGPRRGTTCIGLARFRTVDGRNIEIIYDSGDGANFDTVIESTDPAESPAATDLTFLVGNPLPLLRGDGVQVKYPNPDGKRVNVTIIGTDDYLIGGS